MAKQVYVNDTLVGEARTWDEVRKLLDDKGVCLFGELGAAEGPTAFFVKRHISPAGNCGERYARSASWPRSLALNPHLMHNGSSLRRPHT